MKTLNLLKILVVAIATTSCTVTTSPDGTTTQSVDPAAAALAFDAAQIAIEQYNHRHPVRAEK